MLRSLTPGAITRGSATRARLGAATLALAVLVVGCGGSSKPASSAKGNSKTSKQSAGKHATGKGNSHIIGVTLPDSQPPTPAAIRRAALMTAAEPGYRAKLSASIKIPALDAGPLTAVGTGFFDSKSGTGTVTAALGLPGVLGLAGPLPATLVAVGDEVYLKLPSELVSLLPSLRPWQGASLSELDLSTLNPSVILGQVARDATRKIPDQHAKVTISPKTGLIRTIVLTYYVPGPRLHVAIDLTLTGFGHEPVSTAPPAAKVGRLLSVVKELGL
jgi:hypothetical protein